MDLIQRYEESLNTYNRASGLMDKGRLEEAEALLQTALSLYPREMLMDGELEIAPEIKDSYDMLFGNIRDRLETIEALKGGPRLGAPLVTSLRELVKRNIARKQEELLAEPLSESAVFEPAPRETVEAYSPDSEIETAYTAEPEHNPKSEDDRAWNQLEDLEKKREEDFSDIPEISIKHEEFPDVSEVSAKSEEFPDIETDFSRDLTGAGEKVHVPADETTIPEGLSVEESIHETREAADESLEDAIDSALNIEGEGKEKAFLAELEHREEPAKAPKQIEEELSPEETLRRVSDLADHIADSLKSPPAGQDMEFEAPPPEPQHEPETHEIKEPTEPLAPADEEYFPPAETVVREPVPETASEPALTEKETDATSEQTTEEGPTESMPTETKPGKQNPFKAMSAKASSLFGRIAKKKEKKNPEETADGLETIEPIAGEESMPVAEVPAPEPEPLPEPEPEKPVEADAKPEDDDDDEALLDEDELKKLKEKVKRKPVITVEATVDFTGVFGTIIIIIMFIVGTYLCVQNYISSSAMDVSYQRGSQAVLQGINGNEDVVSSASDYKELIGENANADKAMPYIVAGWSNQLLVLKNKLDNFVILNEIYRKQGLNAAFLDEDALVVLLGRISDEARAGKILDADEHFVDAAKLFIGAGMPEVKRLRYGVRLAKAGNVLYSLSGSMAAKTPKGAMVAREVLVELAALESFMSEKEFAAVKKALVATGAIVGAKEKKK
jgi:hypothetical protein